MTPFYLPRGSRYSGLTVKGVTPFLRMITTPDPTGPLSGKNGHSRSGRACASTWSMASACAPEATAISPTLNPSFRGGRLCLPRPSRCVQHCNCQYSLVGSLSLAGKHPILLRQSPSLFFFLFSVVFFFLGKRGEMVHRLI